MEQKHFHHIDILRGLAAMHVVVYHYLSHNPVLAGSWLQRLTAYGYTGVDMFFVISGFVLPYSLLRAGYTLSVGNYFSFLKKRFIRIYPPYIAIFIPLLIYAWIINIFEQRAVFVLPSIKGIFLHFVFLVEIFGEQWLSPVYWTLPIEWQFYLVVALAFPLLSSRKLWLWALSFSVLLASFYIAPYMRPLLFKYMGLFGLGMLLFYYFQGYIKSAWVFAPLAGGVVAWVIMSKDMPSGIAAGTAGLFIWLVQVRSRPLEWLGKISYSLYLTHYLVGGMFFSAYHEWLPTNPLIETALIAISVAIDVAFAYYFYKYLEAPTAKWAKSSPASPPAAGQAS